MSSTGHGHASIKRIHYVSGKFSVATITAVLTRKREEEFHIPYVYFFLLAYKDELLVPLMRGAANVSLSVDRLARLRVPLPPNKASQQSLVEQLQAA